VAHEPETQSLARNVFSNWLVLAARLAYSLVITPIVVRTLDVERYGVWSFLNGLLAYAEIFYLGLGVAFIKYVAQALARRDQSAVLRLVRVIATLYSVQGAVVLGLMLWVGAALPGVFAQPLSVETASAVSLTCALLGARLLLMFVASIYSGLLAGHERYDLVNVVHFWCMVARFVATPLLLERDYDPLLTMAWIAAAIGACEAMILGIVARRYVRGFSIAPAWPSRSELGGLYGFGLRSVVVLLAIRLISYTDTTVVGLALGAASVAIFSLPMQLVEYGRLAIAGFCDVLLPRVETLSTRQDAIGLQRIYLQTARVACFLTGWLAALLITLGPAFLTRWVGPEYGAPVEWVVTYLALAMFGHVLSAQMPLPFYQALQIQTVPAVVLLVEAILNLGLSLWLAPRLGVNGVALATAIPALGVGMLILPAYLCRRLGVSVSAWIRQSLLPGALMLAGTVALQTAIGTVLEDDAYSTIVIRIVATLPVALAVMMLTFPRDERRVVWNRIAAIARGAD
jgi:O-antigen/teichoic acid export membrane protein